MRSKHRTNPATGCSTLRKCLRKSVGDECNHSTSPILLFTKSCCKISSWAHLQSLCLKPLSPPRTNLQNDLIKLGNKDSGQQSIHQGQSKGAEVSFKDFYKCPQCLLVIRKLKSLSYNKWLFRARKPHSSFIVYRVGTFWKYPFCPNKNSFRTCSQERNPLWEARRSLSKSVKEEKKERKKTYESTVHHRVQTSKFQNKAISRICQNAYLKKIMQDSLQNGIDFRDNRRSVSIRITGTSKHCGGFEWAWYEPYSLITKIVEACLWDAWACAASYREAGWILMCIRTFSSDSAKCSKVVWTVPLSTSR